MGTFTWTTGLGFLALGIVVLGMISLGFLFVVNRAEKQKKEEEDRAKMERILN
jgi:hypothetical protein|tara:strand:- start:208 stop:366 length:159 start_codon:yes stop_codon:yes gene_type:complete